MRFDAGVELADEVAGCSWGPEFMPMPELGGSVEGSMIRIAGSDLLLSATPYGIGPDWSHRCPGPGRCNMTVRCA